MRVPMISRGEDVHMSDDRRQLLKLISICLSYPDDDFFGSLDEVGGCLNGLSDSAIGTFQAFITHLRGQPRLLVQELYTANFDLNPGTSLNFTYHLIGDGEERGRVLAELQSIYHQAGYEAAVNDLPDFLPLVFEFLSETPEGSTPPALKHLGTAVATIAKRLGETGSIYAGLLTLASGLIPAEDSALGPEEVSASRTAHQKNKQLGAQG
jgi:nitrate reductase molybdenum cofactor assembly chaperone NarJ/NarW